MIPKLNSFRAFNPDKYRCELSFQSIFDIQIMLILQTLLKLDSNTIKLYFL